MHNNELGEINLIFIFYAKIMKKLFIPILLLIVFVLAGCSTLIKNDTQPIQQQSENQIKKITRKDELRLE